MIRYKKPMGVILVILGILLLMYPLFNNFKSSCYQKKLAQEFKEQKEQKEQKKHKEQEFVKEKKQELEIPPVNQLGGRVKLEIPRIKVCAFVVYGTTKKQLDRGPGFLEDCASPGENGNVVIAGHRNTGGFWFKDLDQMEKGDIILLKYKDYSFLYSVKEIFVVDKHDWSITEDTGYPALTLFTCHPYGSTEHRLVVRSALTETTKDK